MSSFNRAVSLVFVAATVMVCQSALAQNDLSSVYKEIETLPDRYKGLLVGDEVALQWLPSYRLGVCAEFLTEDGAHDFQYKIVDCHTGEETGFPNRTELLSMAGLVEEPSEPFLHRWTENGKVLRFSVAGKCYRYDKESKDVVADLDAIVDAEPVLTFQDRSESQGSQIFVNFVNSLPFNITLNWLNTQGRSVQYHVLKPGETATQHTFAGHVWSVTSDGGAELCRIKGDAFFPQVDINQQLVKAFELHKPVEQAAETKTRPFTARLEGFNIVIYASGNVETHETEVLRSRDGVEDKYYSHPLRWSPNGRYLLAAQITPGKRREIDILDSAPDDRLQPRRIRFPYTKPGDRLDQLELVLFDCQNESIKRIDPKQYANAFDLRRFQWSPDSQFVTFVYNQRGHAQLNLMRIDAETGRIDSLIEESSPTFVDYAGKFFLDRHYETEEVIWASERSGWNHLYLFNLETGELKNPMTQGEWVVRRVERVDWQRRQIWFVAGGIQPNQDPYYRHLCRVDFDGENLVDLTPGDGDHQWEFSPDGYYLVDTYSRVDLPPVHELRDTETGKMISQIATADMSRLRQSGWQLPERFSAKGRDGETDIYGIIVRPSHYDPAKRYPVIEAIYAGPHSAFVPKSFSLLNEFTRLAELGFIVVKIDGMGTSHRSKAFHDVCWKNLADSGFPDRKLWIQAAANKDAAMDLSRVGIYGGSAGGQSALAALLHHGDFYHAAFSDCGCHDNRMDKIWWNELWMGYPIGPHYAENSNATNVHKLQGRLMLCVGELDRNVDPASTYQVVDALIKADKEFEFLMMPGAGHGAGSSRYGRHRMYRFFEDYFLREN